jgi:hypothetical protein
MSPIAMDPVPVATNGRLRATARCIWCAWEQTLSGVDVRVLARVLGDRYAHHVAAQHPEQVPLLRGES